MTRAELLRFARVGAEARLQELQQEVAAIVRAFPHLRAPTPAATSKVSSNGDGNVERRGTGRRRRTMSREARERIAEAQRKRWAEWRTQHEQPGSGQAGKSVQPRAFTER